MLEGLIRELSDPDDSRFDQEDEHGHYIRDAMYELRRKRRLLPLEVGEHFARASRSNLRYAGVEALSAHADQDALDALLRLYNGSSEWEMRSALSAEIETLAGRLGLTVVEANNTLRTS